MNKLRLIKIYDLKGKIHPIEQYVIDLLDGIEQVLDNDYTFYKKDGKCYFSYNNENNDIITSHKFDYLFEERFNFSSFKETRVIMKYLLEKHLKLKINEVR